MKPYLFGGIALLIVGLFSYSLVLKLQLVEAETLAKDRLDRIESLEVENSDLKAVAERKAGAAEAYAAMTTFVNNLSKGAIETISSYKDRSTNEAKCLDYAPPSPLIDRLRENNIRGQGSKGGAQ